MLRSLIIPGPRARDGFTLIEMLIVVAIMAILAAILFPAFEIARENGRRASCQTNLHQLGLCFVQYSQDSDERFPPGQIYTPNNVVSVGWAGPLYTYAKSTNVYFCPDDPTVVEQLHVTDNLTGVFPVSYAWNLNIPVDGTKGTTYGLPINKFLDPTKSVVLYEANWSGVHLMTPTESDSAAGYMDQGDFWGSRENGQPGGNSWPGIATGTPSWYTGTYSFWAEDGAVHMESGSNYLMADGHVKFYLPDYVGMGSETYTVAGQDVAAGYHGTGPVGSCNNYCTASSLTSSAKQITFAVTK